MLFLAIAVLPHRVCSCSDKDDAVALFLPPSSSYTTFEDFTTYGRFEVALDEDRMLEHGIQTSALV